MNTTIHSQLEKTSCTEEKEEEQEEQDEADEDKKSAKRRRVYLDYGKLTCKP